jgi:hypothetical protein
LTAISHANVKSKAPLESKDYWWSINSNIRKRASLIGVRMLESDHQPA